MPVVINGTSGITSPGETVTGPFVINSNGNDQFRFTDGTQNLYMDTDTNGVAISGGPGQTLGGMYVQNSNGSVSLFTGNNLRLTVNSSGFVTKPFTPMFSAYKDNGNVSGATGNGTLMVFNSTFVNNSSSYNTSNGRFTSPVTGTYYFSFSGMLQNASASADIQIRLAKNGNAFTISNPSNPSANTQGMGFACSGLINLSAGDYVEVYFYSSNTTGSVFYAGGGAFNNFSGFLIG